MWPPSAAVRQCSMAWRTRRCWYVSQDRFFSMKLLPCCRMISATSKGGRFMFLLQLAGPFHLLGRGDFNLLQGIADAVRCRRDKCKYRVVCSILEWPSKTWMVRRSAPASSKCVA